MFSGFIFLIKHPVYNSQINKSVPKDQFKYDFIVLGRHSDFFYMDNFDSSFINGCLKTTYNKSITIMFAEFDRNLELFLERLSLNVLLIIDIEVSPPESTPKVNDEPIKKPIGRATVLLIRKSILYFLPRF